MDRNSSIVLRSGNAIPVVGLGTWLLTRDTEATIAYALELGYPLIDTSSDYGTQPGIGRAIAKSAVGRDDIYLSTKVEETDDAYGRAQRNLVELGLDYVDLLLIHRPPFFGAGERLWDGLLRARDDGMARDIGVSNYSTYLIERLIESSGEAPAVNQIEWSPFGHSDEMAAYCGERQIVIQSYSPLTRATRLRDERLVSTAGRYGKTPAQILIRWNIQTGCVPIPKANQRRHLEENLDVFDFELSETDIAFLDGLNETYSSLGSLPYI